MARSRTARPRVRILIGSATALGPGKVELLEAIARTGSISAAARSMGMSYRRAWLLVDTVNRCFKDDLVITSTGGRGGGGAVVTPLGEEVLQRYRAMEKKAEKSVSAEVAVFAGLLADPARDE
jgi:molybdate transport system regulatory protein